MNEAFPFQVPDYIRNLKPYIPGKPIEETRREYGISKIIKLASNENPLGPSSKAIAAVRAALSETHRYPDGSAYRLKKALSFRLNTFSENLIIGNGSNEVIDMLIRTFCVAGDAIVTSQSAFVAYKICAQIHGVKTHEAKLAADLKFDLNEMARMVRENERARIIFIPNPNNPTGTYLNTDEMRAFLKEVHSIRNGSVLVALDYAYWEYVTAQDLPDAQLLMNEFPNVLVLRTFSKIYGLAGFRVGYGIGRKEVISSLEKVRTPFNVSSVGLVAAEKALEDQDFVVRSREANTLGRWFWESELKDLDIPFWKSQGNFILADVQKAFGVPASEIYEQCLKKGVIFRPVANYGLPGALRISIGTEEENQIAIQVLRTVGRERGRRSQ